MGTLLKDIRVAISFDRRGTSEVITSQFEGDCASLECGQALAKELQGYALGEGSFTDSAVFADLIGECLNLSVGYHKEHSPQETLDVDYLDRLVGKLMDVQWDTLPVVRTPGDYGYTSWEFWGEPQTELHHLILNYPEEVHEFIELLGLEEELMDFLMMGSKEEQQKYDSNSMPQVWPWD